MSDPAFIGKTILVGLTFCEADGSAIEQQQYSGTIMSFDKENGFTIELWSGEMQYLPPDMSAIRPADQGEYRLRAPAEVVVHPDYLCTYTITKPKH
jgi:hypothetical protein